MAKNRLLTGLGIVTSCGMFAVLVMGALVTNTGSGHGCNNTWPLCNGQIIPHFSMAASIEWSHRAVTGVESLLVFAFAGVSYGAHRRRREAQILAPAMILFLLLQALLGAIAAGTHETPAILALHFGVSLISFATIVLMTTFVAEYGGGETLRDEAVRPRLRGAILLSLLCTYFVVYLGAYVVHRGASFACGDWPLCNGAILPSFSAPYPVLVQVAHRLSAGFLVVFLLLLWFEARGGRAARPDLYRGATASLVFVLLQSVSGGILIFSRLDLYAQLLHAALISLLFAALCYTAYHLVPLRRCYGRRKGWNDESLLGVAESLEARAHG